MLEREGYSIAVNSLSYFRGTGHHSQCDIPAIIPTWILRVFRMSAKMDHDQAIELHRKLMTSHFKKCLGE